MENSVVWAYWGHEPSYHLKRMDSRPSIFALGEWSDEWMKRLRSEECIKKIADDGVNVIYTNFFKGFGLEYEKPEIEKTKELVKIAHKYGIKVLGYCQLNSIYYETFLSEDPDAFQMAAKKPDGSPKPWTITYYRWSTCYNSEKFINYIKSVVDYGLDNVGLDGFHFDNSYIPECCCENCKKDFRSYLKRTVSDPKNVMGIDSFDYVEIPYFEEKPIMNFDPLYFYWLKYRHEKCAEVHNIIFKYVKEKSCNKALILHNPAFPRESIFVYNPEKNGGYCDFVMAENHDNLINKNGEIRTQILAYKLAERFGYKVFESSWRTVKNKGNSSLINTTVDIDTATYPETYFQISYYLSQSMIFGGLIGTPWLMRSTHKGNGMILDSTLQRQTHQKVISYFKQNHKLYMGEPVNKVKVLYSSDNLIGMCRTGLDRFKDVVNRIHNADIPFSIIIKDDIPAIDENQTIVVPELFFADEKTCEYLEQAAKRGCKVLVLGEYNVCNIYGKGKDLNNRDSYKDLFVHKGLEENWELTLKKYAGISIDISCPNIVSEITEDKNGNILVHLLSTEERSPVNFSVVLSGLDGMNPISIHSFEDVKFSIVDEHIEIENFTTMATLKMNKKL